MRREIGVFGGDLDDPVVVVGVLVGGGGEGEVFALAHGVDEAIGLVPGQGGGELGQRHAARLQRRERGVNGGFQSGPPPRKGGGTRLAPLCAERRLAPCRLVPECGRPPPPESPLAPDQASRVAAQSRSGRGHAGIGLKVISVAVFLAMASLLKASPGVPPGEMVFFRSFFGIVPIVMFLAWRGELVAGVKTDRPMGHFWRGIFARRRHGALGSTR